ncbi:CGNR zinc finger domain-containing protein [Donghicola sp. C2-DW-16]|uniref:CGNR zinc finger domain-containing protein n=1 Tax=Donghicola mangrovi TaxID=2729614 RepID=A0ABX2PCN1_9RHOB|nr:CGNR zinc finger domain-containing protein [Donghicola mangrovi]NVO27233.1 CGNR zinc finger domain-containing protein [Donghicola mangrovi]
MSRDTRPAPFFVGESPALDFLNSVAKPRSTLFEWLETGEDVLDWMVAAGLATETEVTPFRAPTAATELERARQDIVNFREEFRAFIEGASGVALTDDHHPIIARINGILASGPHYLLIMSGGTGQPYDLVNRHHLWTPADLIIRIAAAAARLITEADFRYVRNCEGPSCTLYFLDVSKNHKRRWCSMEVCGNRAKAAAFRSK